MKDNEIGSGIKEIRKAIGLTAEQFGALIGMSSSYILRMENGDIANPSFQTVMKLAEAVGKYETVVDGSVSLTRYDSLFARSVMVSMSSNTVHDDFKQVEAIDKLSDAIDCIGYLNESELDMINIFARAKAHTATMSKVINNLDDEYGLTEQTEFEPVAVFEKMFRYADETRVADFNAICRTMIAKYDLRHEFQLFEVLMDMMSDFLSEQDVIRQQEQNEMLNSDQTYIEMKHR